MPRFGPYETVRALHRTGFTVVYLGHSATQPTRNCAIKAYRPSVRVRRREVTKSQYHEFLDAAAVQQKVAKQDTVYWAPVYDSGDSPEGPFYVTSQYNCSVQHLIAGRAKLSPALNHLIVHSVTQGLLSLQRICSRPHGNLKFSNILTTGRMRVSEANIVLCDPLPDKYIKPEDHGISDLREIAELIYQLVMHCPTSPLKGWQVPESEEWKRLGPKGDNWRVLCNRLLLVDVNPDTISLETLAEELKQLTFRASMRVKYCVLAAVVTALIGLGAYFWLVIWPTM